MGDPFNMCLVELRPIRFAHLFNQQLGVSSLRGARTMLGSLSVSLYDHQKRHTVTHDVGPFLVGTPPPTLGTLFRENLGGLGGAWTCLYLLQDCQFCFSIAEADSQISKVLTLVLAILNVAWPSLTQISQHLIQHCQRLRLSDSLCLLYPQPPRVAVTPLTHPCPALSSPKYI